MSNNEELTPQARAARVTYLLVMRGQMTTRQVAEEAGISPNGARYLMGNLSVVLPVYQPEVGVWVLDGQPRQKLRKGGL